jgi:L-cysteine/cystine lyase
VLERVAYLNTGTDGPVPRRGAEAAAARIRHELEEGRATPASFGWVIETAAALRDRVAAALGCDAADVALTRSATDGMATALASARLGPGDEVLTSDEEHPGLLAPLEAARRRNGFEVRVAPFAEIANEVGPRTKLVACSHVSWVGGQVVDDIALRETGVPTLLDGAQGLGAVALDVKALGCDFYAAAGQKWLCGPDGSGYLYVRREVADELDPPWPNYMSLADATRASELVVHEGARRFDMGVPPPPASGWALSALELLAEFGWDRLTERATGLAAGLAAMLSERGADVAPRGRSTLVSWLSADAEADVARLAEEGFVVRNLPGRGLVRASVGAWSTEDELKRLVRAALR